MGKDDSALKFECALKFKCATVVASIATKERALIIGGSIEPLESPLAMCRCWRHETIS